MAKKKKSPTKPNQASKPPVDTISLQSPMQYIMRGFVLAMFTFFPLNMSDNWALINTKMRTLYLLLVVVLASALFVLFYQFTQGRKLRIDFHGLLKRIRPYEYAIFAYWIIMLVSALLSPYPEDVWKGASERPEGFFLQSLYLLVFLLVGRFYRPRMQDMLVLCIGCAVICSYGIFQYYGLDFFNISADNSYGPGMTLVTTMSNKNVASTYFTLAFCVGYVCFVQKSARWHWAFFPATLIVFYMLVLGDTESGYVGVLAAGALSLAFVVRDRQSAARLCLLLASCFALLWVHGAVYRLLRANGMFSQFGPSIVDGFLSVLPFAAIFFAVLAAGFWFLKVPAPKLSARAWRLGWPAALVLLVAILYFSLPAIAEASGIRSLQELVSILQGEASDSFMSGRVFAWRRTVTLIPEHLWLGTGPDTFAKTFLPFYEESLAFMRVWFDKAHNEYLQLLIDVGVLGLTAMLAVYFTTFWQARKRYTTDTLTLATGVAMLCFMVQAFFNFSTPIAHPIVWTMWGVFAAAGQGNPPDAQVRR